MNPANQSNVQGYEKWHENYYAMRDHSMGVIPYPIRIVIGILAYRKIMATMHGQGTGRFTGPEIARFREDIWKDISSLLVESKKKSAAVKDKSTCFWVLGGKEPTEVDATLYGFITGCLVCHA